MTAVNSSQAKFLVPFDRDPYFVGREEIIAQVDNRLHIRSRVSLAGIGGVGFVSYNQRLTMKWN